MGFAETLYGEFRHARFAGPCRNSRRCITQFAPDGLSNLNLEEHVIRVFVTPLEILLLLGGFDFTELTIALVLLSQVDAVGTILLAVVHMIVFALLIVVLLVIVSIFGRHGDRGQ